MGNVKIKSPTDFANALLGALGLPDSKTNVANIVQWEAQEGGNWKNPDKYNPLNTTQPAPGSHPTNSVGVQAYTSWQQGIDATVQTMQNGSGGYSQILHDLSVSAPWSQFAANVDSSSWGTKGLNPSTAPATGNPDSQSYGTGVVATQQSGAAADAPSKNTNAKKLQGFAGVLQTMDGVYNPGLNSTVLGFIPNVPKDMTNVVTMVFVRATSAILMAAIIAMGLKTLTSGSSSGSSGGPTNVLEFVNNAQTQNRKLGLAEERVTSAKTKEQDVATRHAQRLADNEATRQSRERVASTPKTGYVRKESHIFHHTEPKAKTKPRVKVQLVDREAYINGSK